MPELTTSTQQLSGSGRDRVLVVDDEAPIRELIRLFLEENGYEVLEATGGESALEAVGDSEVDVVISDVYMPGTGGIELLSRLREKHPDLPVVMVTGMPNVQAAVECMRVGAFDYISKPVDMQRLLEAVSQAMAEVRNSQFDDMATVDRGHIVAGYRLVRTLGEGCTGLVFLAERSGPEGVQQYALKVLKTQGLTDREREQALQRFLHEAEAASKVRHPNVVGFVEYGLARDEQIPYLVMEYEPGRALKYMMTALQERSYRERALLLRQIALGLQAIHSFGMCHRDVKPGNIMVDADGTVARLNDFGIAKLPHSTLTVGGSIMGSPCYMAPEAFSTADLDPRADIFSLGVVGYELLLDQRPFDAETIPELCTRICSETPVEPRALAPDFPLSLQAWLARCLEKDLSSRYQTMDEVLADLDRYLENKEAKGKGLLSRLRTRLGRNW